MKTRLGVNNTIEQMLKDHLLTPVASPKKTTVKKVKKVHVDSDKQKVEDAKQARQEQAKKVTTSHVEQENKKSQAQLKQAVILSEIIGKPRCKTRHRGR